MPRTVLVPIDGSKRSEAALPWAAQVARIHGLTPVLVRVVDTPLYGSSVETYQRQVAAEYFAAATNLDDLREQLAADGLRVETCIRRGEPSAAIPALADELDAAAIVMAMAAKGGLERLLVGSVAESILRRATVPVLLVRAEDDRPARARRPDRILVPLDGSPQSERAVAAAQAFAPDGATILLLRVIEPAERAIAHATRVQMVVNRSVTGWEMVRAQEYLEQRARCIDAARFRVEWAVRVGTPADEIVAAMSDQAVDLIAMGTRARAAPARWLFGSTADAVVRAVERPTLLVNPNDRNTDSAVGVAGRDQANEEAVASAAAASAAGIGSRSTNRAPSPGTLSATRSPS
jgi:nucleotide-binding universal stress UspA family protein